MTQVLSITLILALVLQGTAWAGMAIPQASLGAAELPTAGFTHPDASVVPCDGTPDEDDAAEPGMHANGMVADEDCVPECGCANICAGVLVATLDPTCRRMMPESIRATIVTDGLTKQPEPPFRPPISHLR